MTDIDFLKKAIALAEGATEPLKKSQQSFDFSPGPNPHDHHRAYTRTNASGTVSNIQAKGTPKLRTTAEMIDHHYKEADKYDKMEDRARKEERYEAARRHSEKAEQHRNRADSLESRLPEATPTMWDEDGEIHTSEPQQVWVDPAKQRREMEAAVTTRERNLQHPAFSQIGKDGRVYLHDSKTGRQLDDYEGPFHPNGDISKTLHTWVKDGERNYSASTRQVATASPEIQHLVGTTTELIGDMIKKPAMAKYREVIQRKLDALNANPNAKAAYEVISDVKMIAEKAAKETAPKASRVEVDTSVHYRSHLREPKGRGGWFFSKHKDIDWASHKEGEDYISTPSMTYGEAKKYAKEWAAKKGHSTIYVMP